jgi:hypothetical protein
MIGFGIIVYWYIMENLDFPKQQHKASYVLPQRSVIVFLQSITQTLIIGTQHQWHLCPSKIHSKHAFNDTRTLPVFVPISTNYKNARNNVLKMYEQRKGAVKSSYHRHLLRKDLKCVLILVCVMNGLVHPATLFIQRMEYGRGNTKKKERTETSLKNKQSLVVLQHHTTHL